MKFNTTKSTPSNDDIPLLDRHRMGMEIMNGIEDGSLSPHKICVLISMGASTNLRGEWGQTLLTIAAKKGHKSVINALLNSGVDINETTDADSTALHYAIGHRHEDTVKLLLEKNADPTLAGKNGIDALEQAKTAFPQVVSIVEEAHARFVKQKQFAGVSVQKPVGLMRQIKITPKTTPAASPATALDTPIKKPTARKPKTPKPG